MPEEEKDGYEEIFEEAEANQDDSTSSEDNESQGTNNAKTDADSAQPAGALITKDLAERYGLSRGMIGKPMEELAKSYSELHKLESKNAQQIAVLTKQLGEFSEALTKKEVAKAVETVDDKLPEISQFIDETGYINDPKGYADYLNKRDLLLKKEFKKMLEENEAKNSVTQKTVADIQAEKNYTKLYDGVTDGLATLYDKDADPELIEQAIKEYNDYLESEDEETRSHYARIYSGKPDKLAKDILQFHKANSYSKPGPEAKSNEAAKKAHEKTLAKVKETNKKFTETSSSPRQKTKETSDSDYEELLAEAESERQGYEFDSE